MWNLPCLVTICDIDFPLHIVTLLNPFISLHHSSLLYPSRFCFVYHVELVHLYLSRVSSPLSTPIIPLFIVITMFPVFFFFFPLLLIFSLYHTVERFLIPTWWPWVEICRFAHNKVFLTGNRPENSSPWGSTPLVNLPYPVSLKQQSFSAALYGCWR